MTAFINHFVYEFKTGLRNPTLMLMNYLFPLGFYAMMGAVMIPINPGFADVLIPAIVIVAVMVSTLLGLPGPLVEAREAGIFRSYKINGVPALSILSIPALSTIFHALIVSTIIALTGGPLFKGAVPSSWPNFIFVTLLAGFTFGSIGALIGVIATGSRSTVLWSQIIFLPSMLVGGLMMPLSFLPESIRPLSGLLPTTYAMQAYQGLAYTQDTILDPGISVLVLAASGILAFALSVYLFNWDSQNRSRRAHPLLALLSWIPYIAGIFLA
ncbi:MAG: ABC transporter permease [Anaerolineales bacterium]|nr:MAG: ABC transporter permease [Anaerolineales bacterium]